MQKRKADRGWGSGHDRIGELVPCHDPTLQGLIIPTMLSSVSYLFRVPLPISPVICRPLVTSTPPCACLICAVHLPCLCRYTHRPGLFSSRIAGNGYLNILQISVCSRSFDHIIPYLLLAGDLDHVKFH